MFWLEHPVAEWAVHPVLRARLSWVKAPGLRAQPQVVHVITAIETLVQDIVAMALMLDIRLTAMAPPSRPLCRILVLWHLGFVVSQRRCMLGTLLEAWVCAELVAVTGSLPGITSLTRLAVLHW